MVVGIGIDIVEVEDMRNARFKKRVAEYFLTKKEISQMPQGRTMVQFLASRFALKEAVIKAFPGTLSPFEFSIVKKGRKPKILFHSAHHNKSYGVYTSITHTATTAAAIAVIFKL